MRLSLTAAAFGAALIAAPALADGHATMQTTDNGMLVWAYPAKNNYCPAGLQPVVVGGVICCGTPNFSHNPNMHPAPRKVKHAPRAVVAYSKSPSDVVVFEKGQ